MKEFSSNLINFLLKERIKKKNNKSVVILTFKDLFIQIDFSYRSSEKKKPTNDKLLVSSTLIASKKREITNKKPENKNDTRKRKFIIRKMRSYNKLNPTSL